MSRRRLAVRRCAIRSPRNQSYAHVRDFCKGELAAYNVPKFIKFLEEWPKSHFFGKRIRREDLKDAILVSGFMVVPSEVEMVIEGLAGVKECAVIGVPAEATGEAVKAIIVRGDPALDAETVRDFCRSKLAGYKVPKFIEFREDLEDLRENEDCCENPPANISERTF